jgi:hypothetical protein
MTTTSDDARLGVDDPPCGPVEPAVGRLGTAEPGTAGLAARRLMADRMRACERRAETRRRRLLLATEPSDPSLPIDSGFGPAPTTRVPRGSSLVRWCRLGPARHPQRALPERQPRRLRGRRRRVGWRYVRAVYLDDQRDVHAARPSVCGRLGAVASEGSERRDNRFTIWPGDLRLSESTSVSAWAAAVRGHPRRPAGPVPVEADGERRQALWCSWARRADR